jgi:hypothetical protein
MVRRPAHEAPSLIVCRCLLCGHMVGASKSEALLDAAEKAHNCESKKFPAVSVKKMSA